MNHILQIFTGHFEHPGPKLEDVQCALDNALQLLHTEDVIFGWSTGSPVYEPMLKMLKERGMKVWLWLPMFSELPQQYKHHLSWTTDGEIQKGTQVIEGEDFQFVCPSSPENIQNPVQIYNKYFSHLPFDGIFLDKIRHNSFSAGLESGLGCYCPVCKKRYTSEGIDIDAFIRKVNENVRILLPADMQLGRYIFADPLVDSVYKCKAGWITNAIRSASSSFSQMGLEVSLDVFASLLSYLVGQDINTLASGHSFIKPMVYRITKAPAGIPFELQSLQNAFMARGCDPLPVLRDLWDVEDLLGDACTMKQAEVIMQSDCPIYPGFEINDVAGICDNNPEYVKQNKALYEQAGLEGIVLSWNLLGAPEACIRALI